MKISREVKAAILVISGILLFIYLFNYLKGDNLFNDTTNFYTQFDYNALSMSSPVTIKGNKVGKVEDIKYDFESGKTLVYFSVDPQLKFSKNSTIRLYETGIMGGNALAIIDAEDGEIAKKGDYIKSEVQPGLISSLKENFTGLGSNLDSTLQSADTLMVNLNKIVASDSEDGLKATIAELNKTIKSFRGLSYSFNELVKNNEDKIDSLLGNFSDTSKELTMLVKDLNDAEISKTIKDFDATLLKINGLIEGLDNGEGTMGKLLNDDALYKNLEGASKELELLLLDIKLHPARYRRILSKKEIPYEAPTEEQMND